MPKRFKRTVSDFDLRAAEIFAKPARDDVYFDLTCDFGILYRKDPDDKFSIGKREWASGRQEFQTQFGNAAEYFAGAFLYVAKSTGWRFSFPFAALVHVDRPVEPREHCNGLAMRSQWRRRGKLDGATVHEMKVIWDGDEITETVLHEIVHLFKPCGSIDDATKRKDEEWVEAQAQRMVKELACQLVA